MLALGYLLTAIIIGSAVFLSAFAPRRKFPSRLPDFCQNNVEGGKSEEIGVNPIRDKTDFSERLGRIRVVTSMYHQIIKRY
jgi:hypothetical protein